jgi:hypothetical protein
MRLFLEYGNKGIDYNRKQKESISVVLVLDDENSSYG